MKSIVFTGGGTAGHVTPNLALMDALKADDWQCYYIGSAHGVEKKLVSATNVPFYSIRSGKLRRYFSWQNFIDPFNILCGIIQAAWLLYHIKPQVVFSKGGYVALPVVIGAKLNRIPVIAHESDMTPGLANRLSFPFVDKICLTFAAAKTYFKQQNKVIVTGTPIREQLFSGDATQGLAYCGFKPEKPCILIIGGGQGSIAINRCVRQALPQLCETFQIIHICGQDKIDPHLIQHEGYCQFEYVHEELAHLFAASDLVISRAGANTLSEILALAKPHVLIPLPLRSSRGDQIENARYFQQQEISIVLNEDGLTLEALITAVHQCYEQRVPIMEKMKALQIQSATARIVETIKTTV